MKSCQILCLLLLLILQAPDTPAATPTGAVLDGPSATVDSVQWAADRDSEGVAWSLDRDAPHGAQVSTLVIDGTGPAVRWSWDGPARDGAGRTIIGPRTRPVFTVDDPAGVKTIEYALDGSDSWRRDLPAPLPLTTRSVWVRAIDELDNVTAAEVAVTIDATGPAVQIELLSEMTDAPGFSTRPAQVRITATDDHSSATVTQPAVQSPAVVHVEENSLSATAADEFGNESVATLTWRYDEQAPRVWLEHDGTEHPPGRTIRLKRDEAVVFHVEDEGVGVSNAEYRYNRTLYRPVPTRLRFDDRGRYNLRVKAVDRVGNEEEFRWKVLAR